MLNEGAGLRYSGGLPACNAVAKDPCTEVGVVAGLLVLCGSLAVSSLWSGGISGQGMTELEEVRTENLFL